MPSARPDALEVLGHHPLCTLPYERGFHETGEIRDDAQRIGGALLRPGQQQRPRAGRREPQPPLTLTLTLST